MASPTTPDSNDDSTSLLTRLLHGDRHPYADATETNVHADGQLEAVHHFDDGRRLSIMFEPTYLFMEGSDLGEWPHPHHARIEPAPPQRDGDWELKEYRDGEKAGVVGTFESKAAAAAYHAEHFEFPLLTAPDAWEDA